MARIKGAAFREFLHWYGETHDAARLVEAWDAVPVGNRGLLDPAKECLGVLPATWYPAPAVHAILDALLAGRSTRERAELARAGARATLDRTLRGVYGLLFAAMATPERYARHVQRLWNAYYDTGEVRIELTGPTRALSRITGWDAHHRFICDMHEHAAVFIYEAMGKRVTLSTRLACVATGGDACRFETGWEE